MAKGFETSAPEAPRNGQHVAVSAFTDNENPGVVVVLAPWPGRGAAVEQGAGSDEHGSWHAAQAGATPKKMLWPRYS